MRPSLIFMTLWITWALSWAIASFWSAQTEKQVPTAEVWTYRIAITAGAILLWHRTGVALHAARLWHVGYTGAYVPCALTFLGIAFAWWARIHLGRLWSGAITRKEGHRIIDTGPYAIVRHPIYTGLGLSVLASAAAEANVTAVFGAALILLGMWLKARIEERFLAAELGQPAYDGYRARVPMLVPFLPAGEKR